MVKRVPMQLKFNIMYILLCIYLHIMYILSASICKKNILPTKVIAKFLKIIECFYNITV